MLTSYRMAYLVLTMIIIFNRMRWVLSVVGFFFMTTVAFAGHPLVTDDTCTQGKGNGQVEVGLAFFYDKDSVDEWTEVKKDGGDFTVVATVGLLDTVDAIVQLPYAWYSVKENDNFIGREDGILDFTFDVKWRLLEKDGWSLAIKPGVSIPTGDDERALGVGHMSYRFFLVGTREWGPFAAHVNAGYARSENVFEANKDLWHASAAFEVKVMESLKLMANAGIDRNPNPESENHPAFLLGGIAYAVSERITLDAGVKYGLSDTEINWTGLAGLTIRF